MPSFNETKNSIPRNDETSDVENDDDDDEEDDDYDVMVTEGLKVPQVIQVLRNLFETIQDFDDSNLSPSQAKISGVSIYKNARDKRVDKQLLLPIVQASLRYDSTINKFNR